jgi:uncharacterized membrane protein
MSVKKTFLILFLTIAAVAIVELCNLTAMSLWHDESFSALLIKYDFNGMIERIKMDVHPPFYYILLRGWDLFFGNSLFSLRLFSVLFSILATISIYIFVEQAFKNRNLALFSALLFVLSCFQIQYAMEARMYSLGTFLVIISSYFLLKAIETKKWNWWLFYAIATSLGIYTHYFVAFWIFAQGLYLAYIIYQDAKFSVTAWLKNKNFQLGLSSYVLVAVSYIPWIKTLIEQNAQVQQDYWIPPINIWSVPNTLAKMTGGGVVDPAKSSYVLVFLMAMIFLAIFLFLKKNQAREKWLITFSLIIPFVLTVALSIKRPIYVDRYFIFGFPFYSIILAGAILLINNKWTKFFLIVIAILGFSIAFPVRWNRIDIQKKPGMAGASAYLNKEFKPNEKIFVGSSFVYFTFKYYNQTDANPLLYTTGYMPHYSGTALLSPEDIITDFNKEVKKDEKVWMINTTGFGNYRPTVPDNWVKEDEKGFEDAYPHLGRIVISRYKVK